MTALIDADSIIYIVGWYFKNTTIESKQEVEKACDGMVSRILKSTNATSYLGAFSSTGNFRKSLYKFAPYKGTRKPKDEWVLLWESVIKEHLCKKWGFLIPYAAVEADDIIASVHEQFTTECIVCSPDKDLQQLSGLHFNYKKMDDGIKHVDADTAAYNFWLSMLTGDTVDNVKGIIGLGPVKSKGILIGKSAEEMEETVKEQYIKYFGEYYGPIIYNETLTALLLLCKKHPVWNDLNGLYKNSIETFIATEIRSVIGKTLVEEEDFTPIDKSLFRELGWE